MNAHLIRQGLKGLLQLCGATALALLVVSCTMGAVDVAHQACTGAKP